MVPAAGTPDAEIARRRVSEHRGHVHGRGGSQAKARRFTGPPPARPGSPPPAAAAPGGGATRRRLGHSGRARSRPPPSPRRSDHSARNSADSVAQRTKHGGDANAPAWSRPFATGPAVAMSTVMLDGLSRPTMLAIVRVAQLDEARLQYPLRQGGGVPLGHVVARAVHLSRPSPAGEWSAWPRRHAPRGPARRGRPRSPSGRRRSGPAPGRSRSRRGS
jgi:hypothetical protein